MDIKKIEILLRALELKSLAGAAEEYNYTPSALSHMTDSIEKELGIKLIKRGFTGIEPCDGMEKILSLLEKMTEIEKEVKLEAAKIKMGENSLTVGTYASLSRHILPEITKVFREKHPEVILNIIVSDKPLPLLLSGKADVILEEPRELPDCEVKMLSEDYYFAVFPEDNVDSGNSFSWDMKYDNTFILSNELKVIENIRENNYRDIIRVNSDDDGTVVDMVAAGAGISVLPMLSLKGAERVKIIPLNPPLKRKIGLTYKKYTAKNSALGKFIKFAEERRVSCFEE